MKKVITRIATADGIAEFEDAKSGMIELVDDELYIPEDDFINDEILTAEHEYNEMIRHSQSVLSW